MNSAETEIVNWVVNLNHSCLIKLVSSTLKRINATTTLPGTFDEQNARNQGVFAIYSHAMLIEKLRLKVDNHVRNHMRCVLNDDEYAALRKMSATRTLPPLVL